MSERRAEQDDRRLLGDLLIEAGLVTRGGLLAALEEQRMRGGRLGYHLVRLGKVTPAALHLFLQESFAVLAPDLLESLRRGPAVDLVPARLAHHYNMMPVRVDDGVLSLAIAAADSPRLIPAVEELTGLRVEPMICPPSLIGEALSRFYPAEVESGVIYRPAGDNVFVLSDRRRGLRPLLPEALREDAPAADWLRAIGAEAIRRQAKGLRIEPRRSEVRVAFRVAGADEPFLSLPRGVYLGLSALIEGLSRLAGRGRVVPREGRVALASEGRRLIASVLALPGLEGETYAIDLRVARVATRSARDLRQEVPALAAALDRLAARARGVLIVTSPGAAETAAGVAAVLDLLEGRLPRRIALGEWSAVPGLETLTPSPPEGGEELPLDVLLEQVSDRGPDLLLLPQGDAASAPAAFVQAHDRVVLLPVEAADAFAAVERLVRLGLGHEAAEAGVEGVLGVRLMESLCPSCRRACDLQDLLSPGPRHRRIGPGPYFTAPGCPACRGSGVLVLQPVFELLEVPAAGDLFRPGMTAAALRQSRAREGMETLVLAALRKSAEGILDVREPLRLLLHEQA